MDMMEDYIILGVLLIISFDIWNQIKSINMQTNLLSINNRVDDFDTEHKRMKRVDEIYEKQTLDNLTTQNNIVKNVPENTIEISDRQLRSLQEVNNQLARINILNEGVIQLTDKLGKDSSIREYQRDFNIINTEIKRDLSEIKQMQADGNSSLEAAKDENQNLYDVIDTIEAYFSTDITNARDQLKDIEMRLTIDD